ncbi:hypothetical protein [Saccharothrix algeriensis]|uniref:Uncharacterized protein n=1 Tax=Saccharothrix algeriensis TaxID=173560 RepID=A0A8T8HTJ2_9PSEU|nr:hypothetical protein [Saccharothrix algeriensis]MBM7812804.1 hypothetical protein [Saccharothrix algeriensis]QTR01470.1 hypothetical protein J7S33_18930 [Saccharothrix algeriensis]
MSTTPPSGPLPGPPADPPTPEQRHDELLQRIGGLLLDAAPEDFRRIDLLVRMTVAVQDLALTVYRPDGSTPEVLPPEELTAAFQEMRRVLHQPGRGTWFSCRCVVNAPVRIDITYNFDHDPLFSPPVPAADFARDLEVFPRDEVFLPDWLRAKLAEAATEERNA